MQKIGIIYNKKSGQTPQETQLKKLKAPDHSQVDFFQFDGAERVFHRIVAMDRQRYTTVVAAGGDGTVSLIAGALVSLGLKMKLGILPTGTFNHFAQDVGIPPSIPEAFKVILDGHTKLVDIGKVNDQYFINGTSLGLYPRLVRARTLHQKNGFPKSFATVLAFLGLGRFNYPVTLKFESAEGSIIRKTSLIFIGNNKYEFTGLALGVRRRIDEGILSIFTTGHKNYFLLFLEGLRGTIFDKNNFTSIGLKSCTIDARQETVLVAYDGEVRRIKNPLTFETVPKALSVIVPQS